MAPPLHTMASPAGTEPHLHCSSKASPLVYPERRRPPTGTLTAGHHGLRPTSAPATTAPHLLRLKDNVKLAQRHLNATSTHSGIESLPTTSPRFWKTRRMTTTPTTDEDELNDDYSYDGWR
ncbi:hypothetical protein U9M48_033055 [Paspalum notatum var. saurae]|uniref:Uncharacterized protein n=1 Tax=Paspalum notatum var. saurae TaxID=547442 RepID=A0AAQ3X5Y7_PASNO